MTPGDSLTDHTPTLTFAVFWEWVVSHQNCILRAGTPETVIYDDDDYHWHFARESTDTLLVQVIRGKRLVGELLIPRDRITYVQGALGDQEGEFIFELVGGDERESMTLFFFVLTHGYDLEDEQSPRRVH